MTVTALERSFALVMNEADRQREWIGKLIAYRRSNATRLAVDAKIAPSTLSKFLAGARPGHVLDTHTVAKIGRATGFVFPEVPKDPGTEGLTESDAVIWRAEDEDDDDVSLAAKALCRGHNGRDPWIMRSMVLAELGVLPGDILVVDMNETARSGDLVCAQVYGPKNTAETVFRLYREPMFLVGAGPGARLPIIADGRGAQIRGVVVGLFRARGITAAVA